eukprot:7567684-Alexandrium_andersonii.AAC.1
MVDQALASTRRLGHHLRILLRTDNEPALLDLRRTAAERLGVQTAQESPPRIRATVQWLFRER